MNGPVRDHAGQRTGRRAGRIPVDGARVVGDGREGTGHAKRPAADTGVVLGQGRRDREQPGNRRCHERPEVSAGHPSTLYRPGLRVRRPIPIRWSRDTVRAPGRPRAGPRRLPAGWRAGALPFRPEPARDKPRICDGIRSGRPAQAVPASTRILPTPHEDRGEAATDRWAPYDLHDRHRPDSGRHTSVPARPHRRRAVLAPRDLRQRGAVPTLDGGHVPVPDDLRRRAGVVPLDRGGQAGRARPAGRADGGLRDDGLRRPVRETEGAGELHAHHPGRRDSGGVADLHGHHRRRALRRLLRRARRAGHLQAGLRGARPRHGAERRPGAGDHATELLPGFAEQRDLAGGLLPHAPGRQLPRQPRRRHRLLRALVHRADVHRPRRALHEERPGRFSRRSSPSTRSSRSRSQPSRLRWGVHEVLEEEGPHHAGCRRPRRRRRRRQLLFQA